jgi:hypothetical protein
VKFFGTQFWILQIFFEKNKIKIEELELDEEKNVHQFLKTLFGK